MKSNGTLYWPFRKNTWSIENLIRRMFYIDSGQIIQEETKYKY